MVICSTKPAILCWCLLPVFISPQAAQGDLLALYTFDDGLATDVSCNGNHGIFAGLPTAYATGGPVDGLGYLQFGRPAASYIQTPLSIDPEDVPKLTMGAWAQIHGDTAEGIRQLLTHDDGGWDRSLGTDVRGVYDGGGDTRYRWTGFTGSGPLGHTMAFGGWEGEWIFLAAVYDQDDRTMTLYMDDMSYTVPTSFGPSARHLKIGGNPVWGEYWEGDIDNVFVFDQALSAAEIEAIRLGGPEVIKQINPRAPRTLTRYWDFDDGTLQGFERMDGTAFDNQPTLGDNPQVRNAMWVNTDGTHLRGYSFVGTYENHPTEAFAPGSAQGDAPTGFVETDPFVLAAGAHFDFVVGGGDHPWDAAWDPDTNPPPANRSGPTTINLEREVSSGDWEVVFSSTGLNNEAMHFVRWDAAAYAGETVRLRIYDYNTGSWGHINVDDIKYFRVGSSLGDFSEDGALDSQDIDLLSAVVRTQTHEIEYDLTGDGLVTEADRAFWVGQLAYTYFGDANLDGEFNSVDFVRVFQAGKYETGDVAGWGEGDWDGSGSFATSDFVTAFQDGGYEQGLRQDRGCGAGTRWLAVVSVGTVPFVVRRAASSIWLTTHVTPPSLCVTSFG